MNKHPLDCTEQESGAGHRLPFSGRARALSREIPVLSENRNGSCPSICRTPRSILCLSPELSRDHSTSARSLRVYSDPCCLFSNPCPSNSHHATHHQSPAISLCDCGLCTEPDGRDFRGNPTDLASGSKCQQEVGSATFCEEWLGLSREIF
jgi:hypothetical protein